MTTINNTQDIFLTEDEFAAQYPLRRNHLDPDAGWTTGDDDAGCLFEIYGDEFELVRKQDPATVWTWVDGENGQLVLGGLHFCNRIGYLVSTTSRPPDMRIVVRIEDSAQQ